MSLQSGKGDFPVYRGVSRQYGNGLGSIFKAALRTVIPILKPVAKASLKSVKKVAKDPGVQALKDIVGGENVKKVLKQRGKTALKSFGQSTINQLAINSKVSNGAKIRNRYNQVPHLTQDTNGKVTNSQKTPQTRAKRSALSQQVTTKHI